MYRLLPFSLVQVYQLLPFSLVQVYRLLPFSLAYRCTSSSPSVLRRCTSSSPSVLRRCTGSSPSVLPSCTGSSPPVLHRCSGSSPGLKRLPLISLHTVSFSQCALEAADRGCLISSTARPFSSLDFTSFNHGGSDVTWACPGAAFMQTRSITHPSGNLSIGRTPPTACIRTRE
ncbi:unnamed protein product, partial [Staurois parvus]